MTGMFLQISCSIIRVRRAHPDTEGKSTSVNMRSMLCGLSFSISHAFKPSETVATAQQKRKKRTKSSQYLQNGECYKMLRISY